jgi:cysteinyl-tRNA synthetase
VAVYDRTMRLQDTLTGTLVELPPAPAKIGMYVCGPTVYARAHIGNARPFVVFTWLARWLRTRGYDVRLVHNVTDVNDKIYEAAPGHSAALAREATGWYLEDTAGFGLGMPDSQPLATETIPEIIELIEELIESGHAYAVDGDVYFRVARFETYGALSGQRPDQVAEQEPSPQKEDPRDFALWKATKEGEDTFWEAPWGVGRPGWHIECSAMAAKELGPEFWIHGGGLDLVFPHHENERAQSLAVGHPFARIWMHNGMLRFTGEKMSKSVGNVATIREVLDEWGAETALVFFLTGHWRKPIDFSEETMAAAAAQWRGLSEVVVSDDAAEATVPSWDDFAACLEDDFNTPEALSVIHRWHGAGNADLLSRGLDVFGLPRPVRIHKAKVTLGLKFNASVSAEVSRKVPPHVVELFDRRMEARRTHDYATSDELRASLRKEGFEVEDTQDGSRLVIRDGG